MSNASCRIKESPLICQRETAIIRKSRCSFRTATPCVHPLTHHGAWQTVIFVEHLRDVRITEGTWQNNAYMVSMVLTITKFVTYKFTFVFSPLCAHFSWLYFLPHDSGGTCFTVTQMAPVLLITHMAPVSLLTQIAPVSLLTQMAPVLL